MTVFVGINSLAKSYGTQVLFTNLSFTITKGDRIGLIGPNGAGKSTLLKIIAQLEEPDGGTITRKQNLRLAYTSQFPVFPQQSVEAFVAAHALQPTEEEKQITARILLDKAQFTDLTQDATTVSGGWKKRLDIVRALSEDPDLLLLDEPTNHLDLEGILWLEQLLGREHRDFVVVSHDRYFLENICTKIIELNRAYPQGLFISDGTLSTFMERREAYFLAQQTQARSLASTVRYETEWLKRGPKARTTKSRSRIQRAYELIEDLEQIQKRNKIDVVSLDFASTERETKKLLVAKNVSKSIDGRELFKGIELTLSPGSRLGVVGKNGTGKTTLLKILANQLPLDSGTIKYADGIRLVYFDQHREQVNPNATLRDALSPAGEFVNYHGQQIHVHGWAKKFLFPQERLTLPVRCLSGGERARILIAQLILQPADILFLDEPTNDLDIETLEVIEASLKEFAGAVVLISHDRCLMDRVCTQILGLGCHLEANLFSDYSQWEAASKEKKSREQQKPGKQSLPVQQKPKKLSYHEQKELDSMEETIAQAEAVVTRLQGTLALSSVTSDPNKSLLAYNELAAAQKRVEDLFLRWEFLCSKDT